jgi:hypothetical protein
MCCEKKVIELKHHAVLVYENVLFAEGRSLAFRSTFLAHCKQFVESNKRMFSMAHCFFRATYCFDQTYLIFISHCAL